MTHARLTRAERSALRQFVDAVVAFADDPGPANLERYLAASRSLEGSRRAVTPSSTAPNDAAAPVRFGEEQFAAPNEAV